MAKLKKEQIEVICHDKGNILVSASAGSGKTFTMIERIKRLVIEEGVKLNEILAVTFTEASAGDMKEKLKNALVDVISGKSKSEKTGEEFTDGQKRACQEQLGELATADICTMHAFCGRLIRSYFFEVGLSPDFKILDKAEANVYQISSVEKIFKEFYESGEEWFLTLVDRYAQGRQDEFLKELVLNAYRYCDSEAKPLEFADKYKEVYTEEKFEYYFDEFNRRFHKDIEELKADLQQVRRIFDDENLEKLLGHTDVLLGAVNFVEKCDDVYEIKEKLNGTSVDLRKAERKMSALALDAKGVLSEVKDKFFDIIERLYKCLGDNKLDDKARFFECRESTENFVKLLKRFYEVYAEEKREENALDFNDLEHFALEILSKEQEVDGDIKKYVAEDVKAKYSYVFIDEYQDTNGVQEDIISLISNDNLFMVGDVKQSIYGFRGCRSQFFTEKDKKMTDSGEKVVRLNHNFRSAQKILDAVNDIFNFCMTEEYYGENYKGKSELIPGGLYPVGYEGRASLHYLQKQSGSGSKPEEKPRVYDVLEQVKEEKTDVQALSTLIADIIYEEKKKKICDISLVKKCEYYKDNKCDTENCPIGNKCYRAVENKDITVLSRAMDNKYVSELVAGLIKNGVEVGSDVNENVCDFPEIKVMINALKLVDCFLLDLPLASTLKSPIGGFSDEDLFEIARFYDDNYEKPKGEDKGGFSDAFAFYIENALSPLKQRLLEFKAYFESVRLKSDFIGAHGVLDELIEHGKIIAHLYAEPLGESKVFRLRRFVSASVAGGKTLTVREFLLRIKSCPEAFEISPFSTANTVNVTTIHSSKGLEYPVVIVCGLENGFNKRDLSKEIMMNREHGFIVKHFDDDKRERRDTLLRGVVREEMRDDLSREEMRLLYVATTRATYSLHMTFWVEKDSRRSDFRGAGKYLDCIPKSFVAEKHELKKIEEKLKEEEEKPTLVVQDDEEATKKMRSDFSFSYAEKENCALPLKASVTKVVQTELDKSAKSLIDGEDVTVVEELFDEETPNTESGTIAHKILENFDFNSSDDVYKQVENMLESDKLSSEELAKVNLDRLNKALSGEVFCRIKNKTLFREKCFLINVEANKVLEGVTTDEPILIQGVIDLLAIGENSAEIIDYKYSSLSKEKLKAKYKKQLELYSYAVEKVLKIKVEKQTLVNIFSGETVEV